MDQYRTILQDPELISQVVRAQHLLFSLDFDGTLAPIVDRPDQAVLPAVTGAVLRALEQVAGVTVSIISGRSLVDIKSRVGIDGLIYSGNHGLEIEGPGIRFVHPRALALGESLRRITEEVASAASSLDGVEIEWKHLTASLHYRRASAFVRRELMEILRESRLGRDRRFMVREGKKVYDLRPRIAWNKGDAVRLIQGRLQLRDALVVVAGDDMTDEDAFEAFDDSVTICVAPRHQTAAHYTVASCEEFREFLAAVTCCVDGGRASCFTPGPFPAGTSRSHAAPT
jgi:trehalose 6-phosphate phosphatase